MSDNISMEVFARGRPDLKGPVWQGSIESAPQPGQRMSWPIKWGSDLWVGGTVHSVEWRKKPQDFGWVLVVSLEEHDWPFPVGAGESGGES